MDRCDVLIAGAGPAGCAAAVAALSAFPSLDVTLVEACRFPRDKLCGGAITGGGLRELQLAGLKLRVPHVVVRHAVLRGGGRTLRVELPRPAAVARRLELDADLAAQVRERGARILEGARLLSLRTLPRVGYPGVAETGAGPISFRTLICADGVAGPSRRLLGLPPGRRALLREALAQSRSQEDLIFDLDAGVRGYAWRFPCVEAGNDAENAGVYSLARAAAGDEPPPHGTEPEGLAQTSVRWAEAEGLGPLAFEAYALRLFEPGGPVGVPGALLAGEALGADPLAGEGIRYALWSGRIAGRLAARAMLRGSLPSPRAYRLRLATSRSGATLALTARLAPHLHLGDPRWRRIATERPIAEAVAALISGRHPLGPIFALAGRYRRLTRALS
jgi:flavin-dependent dehydrogenase